MIHLEAQIRVKRLFIDTNIEPRPYNGVLQAKTVEPSTEDQAVVADEGFHALSVVTVKGAKLQEKTIKPSALEQTVVPDVGVLGLSKVIVEPQGNHGLLERVDVSPSQEEQTITPSDGYYGIERVTVKAAPLRELNVYPSSEKQTLAPDEGYYGFSSVIVEAADSTGGDPNAPSAGDIYFGTEMPVSYTSACYEATNTTLTGTIEAAFGDWVLATVTTRSATTFPAGWTVLRESTVLDAANSSQRMAFICRKATKDGEISCTITQSTSARIYLNLIAFNNVDGFAYHAGAERYANAAVNADIVIMRPAYKYLVWGCSAELGGTGKQWSCDDLTPISLDPTKTAPRQANFVDRDFAVSQRIFNDNTGNGTCYIIDCVELLLPEVPETDYEPEYSMPKDWYDDVAEETQRITNTPGLLTPDDILSKLKGVQAVYPDVTDAYLGYDGATGQIPTGFLKNPDTNQATGTFQAYPNVYKYHYMYAYNNELAVYQFELPIKWTQNSVTGSHIMCHDGDSRYVTYRCYPPENWKKISEGISKANGSMSFPTLSNWSWCNHNIYTTTGSIHKAAGSPLIVETSEGAVEVMDTYTANGEDVNSIILTAQKITGATSPMTFKQAVWVLEDYAAGLG